MAALLATVLTLATVSAMGAITITLQGNVDAVSGSVFGQAGTNVPVTVSLTLNNSATSTMLSRSDDGANEPLYGYQFTAVTGLEMMFGSKMWDTAALDLLTPKGGFEADLWLNANLALGTPTKAWMQFSDGDGSIQFGSLTTDPELVLQSTISVVDYSGGGFGNTAVGSLNTITSIPEPSAASLVLTGIAISLLTVRRRIPKQFID